MSLTSLVQLTLLFLPVSRDVAQPPECLTEGNDSGGELAMVIAIAITSLVVPILQRVIGGQEVLYLSKII